MIKYSLYIILYFNINISLNEKGYVKDEKIGEGAFGKIYQIKHLNDDDSSLNKIE